MKMIKRASQVNAVLVGIPQVESKNQRYRISPTVILALS